MPMMTKIVPISASARAAANIVKDAARPCSHARDELDADLFDFIKG
jgi:hypothetical protein